VGDSSGLQEADHPDLPAEHWAGKTGYDRDFLGIRIDLDQICARAKAKGLLAPLLDGSGEVLDYSHFSVVIHKARKFPLLTAVNIDGARLVHPGKRKDTWRRDARIADE